MSCAGERPDRLGALASFAIPFALALSHAVSSPDWRTDLPLLRGLAWVGISGQGTLSTLIIHLVSFLPAGGIVFRGAAAAAMALGGVGWSTFRMTHRLLERSARAPRLSIPLAVVAAIAATCSATGQREGTVAGGGALAAFVALTVLLLAEPRPMPGDRGGGEPGARDATGAVSMADLRWGALWGALATESLVLSLVVLLAIAGRFGVERKQPSREGSWRFALGAALGAGFLLLPLATAPFAPSFLELGRAAADLGAATLPASRETAIGAWLSEMGIVALALSAVGSLAGLFRGRLRGEVAPLVVFVATDRLASFGQAKGWPLGELGALHLVSMAALAATASLAIHAAAILLHDLRLPMARGAAVFLVMFDLALVAAAAENTSFLMGKAPRRGAETFVDEALVRLPQASAVLVRSPPVALRLWAARAGEGARPDVLIVPTRILGKGRIALGLLRDEPEVQALLRDVSIEGRPLEHALTALADARPLEVELDPSWDRRITSHLTSDHFWLRFAPEPLGPSDRKTALSALKPRLLLALQASSVDDRTDETTAAILQARLKDYVAVSTLLGDRDEIPWLTEALLKVH
jgi:hypothetical protein